MKKTISAIISLMLILIMLGGCGNSENDVSNTPSVGQSSIISGNGEDVNYLDGEGKSVYRIVRSEGNSVIDDAAKSLIKAIRSELDTTIHNVLDSESGDGVYEILVGNTNRPETLTAKKLLEDKGGRSSDYIICSLNKKIVIFSENPSIVPKAVEYFSGAFLKKEGVKNGILYYSITPGNYDSITVNGVEVGRFDFVRPHYNSSYLSEVEMQEISDEILATTGYMIPITHDTETSEIAKYEIIVGNANREGVEKIDDYDKFSIKISGEKVFINGGSAHATAMGVSEFGKMLKKGSVTDGDSVIGSYETAFNNYDKKPSIIKLGATILTVINLINRCGYSRGMTLNNRESAVNLRCVPNHPRMSLFRTASFIFVPERMKITTTAVKL